jgi:hypothetical protein
MGIGSDEAWEAVPNSQLLSEKKCGKHEISLLKDLFGKTPSDIPSHTHWEIGYRIR